MLRTFRLPNTRPNARNNAVKRLTLRSIAAWVAELKNEWEDSSSEARLVK
jgi:hypothetical protein